MTTRDNQVRKAAAAAQMMGAVDLSHGTPLKSAPPTPPDPMPARRYTPVGNMVALAVWQAPRTVGGVALPDGSDASQWETPRATVVATGPECKFVKPGDVVLAAPNTPGTKCVYDGERTTVVPETAILGVIDRPASAETA